MPATRPELKRRLYPVDEAAHYLGISKRTLQTLLKDGEIPKTHIKSRTLLDERDLDEYIERRKKAS